MESAFFNYLDAAGLCNSARTYEIQKIDSDSDNIGERCGRNFIASGSNGRKQHISAADRYLLVREFKLDAKQLKTIEEIKKQKPVPLDKIDKHED